MLCYLGCFWYFPYVLFVERRADYFFRFFNISQPHSMIRPFHFLWSEELFYFISQRLWDIVDIFPVSIVGLFLNGDYLFVIVSESTILKRREAVMGQYSLGLENDLSKNIQRISVGIQSVWYNRSRLDSTELDNAIQHNTAAIFVHFVFIS